MQNLTSVHTGRHAVGSGHVAVDKLQAVVPLIEYVNIFILLDATATILTESVNLNLKEGRHNSLDFIS